MFVNEPSTSYDIIILLDSPVLKLADADKRFQVRTGASDFALAGVLRQQGSVGTWHPVAQVETIAK